MDWDEQLLLDLKKNVGACIFHIEAIKKEEDPEVIKTHIECLEQLRMWPHRSLSTKEAIRIGQGDFAEIQRKCVELGLV